MYISTGICMHANAQACQCIFSYMHFCAVHLKVGCRVSLTACRFALAMCGFVLRRGPHFRGPFGGRRRPQQQQDPLLMLLIDAKLKQTLRRGSEAGGGGLLLSNGFYLGGRRRGCIAEQSNALLFKD